MTRILAVFLLISGSFILGAQDFNQYFTDGALRFDYYRTGNHQSEQISEDIMFHEEFWGGSKVNLLDTFDYGNYKIEVYDSAGQTLIYSRGFSSLFYEWRYTEEARSIYRSFSETVRFPFPKASVKLIFYERLKDMSWKIQYHTWVNPKDYTIVRDNPAPVKSFKIHGERAPEKALDIVLLAEGYTQAEMQKFMNDAQRFVKYLIECEPFKSMQAKINIWAVPSISAESGTDLPGKDIWVNTLFDSHFYTFGTERYLNTLNNKMVRNYAGNAPYDQIYILVNSKKYGGAGIFNYYSICTADHKSSDFVFVHEFGHAMAGLGDEYYTSDVSTDSLYSLNVEPWEPNLTTLKDFGSKWKNLMDDSTPVPTPTTKEYADKTGAFEGAGYLKNGVYRPAYECTMKSVRYDDFCDVCTQAIVDMIEFYAQ
jgi:hypothetical protein